MAASTRRRAPIPFPGARRERHVFANGQILHGANRRRRAQRRRAHREPPDGDGARKLPRRRTRRKREIQRERAAREQEVLQQLRVRAQHREPDDDREHAPRPRAPVANARSTSRSASGSSALIYNFPSCPGDTRPATLPPIMYASPPTSAPKNPSPHARRKRYVKSPRERGG